MLKLGERAEKRYLGAKKCCLCAEYVELPDIKVRQICYLEERNYRGAAQLFCNINSKKVQSLLVHVLCHK